ncbi:MAG: DUF2520 domain-containing protein [Solirubrobacteraceae bacterium]
MLSNIAIAGRGRMGRTLAFALSEAGLAVSGPHARGFAGDDAGVVLLCVPDDEIAAAAARIAPREGLLVGHCSGATGLDALAPHEAFGLHPLMTVTGRPATGSPLAGAGCAVAGSTERALACARELAAVLGMRPVAVAGEDRAAYHAAAARASNFLVALECAAERLAATTGIERADLAPLVRAAAENWARDGAAALTGPIARGDAGTVAAHRGAIADRAPDLLELYDVLADTTRTLAAA